MKIAMWINEKFSIELQVREEWRVMIICILF